ncbi:MAG: nickel pincer cofactor biosynthesis protein LarB [Candidatus Thorarchaeota archaeon]|nr:nickel pincer cofactor biosynthesis protein LarB [Candidatus Thorarchaeota archaeon]
MSTRKKILRDLKEGRITIDEAEKRLKMWSLGKVEEFALLDSQREERSGIPEVVYGASKSIDQLIQITESMLESNGYALLTRLDEKKTVALEAQFSDQVVEIMGSGEIHTAIIRQRDWEPPVIDAKIAIITAGTSDIPYACEVEAVAYVMGVKSLVFNDVGVAGVHRLIRPLQKIIEEDVVAIVVLAGMEGALPTFIASLVDIPVIGVPIPTGYGFGGEGETALAAMLQSCAPGIAVVNIGNGIGAGAFACLIAKKSASRRIA